MFTKPLSLRSATSGTAFTYCDEINLTSKWFDNKNLNLKIDISQSSASGLMDIIGAVSDRSGATFASFVTGSGSSLILTSGTSTGGQLANGSYFIPLTIVTAPGVTECLKGTPYIKFGLKASYNDVTFSGSLIIG